jgi:hypothetical protein
MLRSISRKTPFKLPFRPLQELGEMIWKTSKPYLEQASKHRSSKVTWKTPNTNLRVKLVGGAHLENKNIFQIRGTQVAKMIAGIRISTH